MARLARLRGQQNCEHDSFDIPSCIIRKYETYVSTVAFLVDGSHKSVLCKIGHISLTNNIQCLLLNLVIVNCNNYLLVNTIKFILKKEHVNVT